MDQPNPPPKFDDASELRSKLIFALVAIAILVAVKLLGI